MRIGMEALPQGREALELMFSSTVFPLSGTFADGLPDTQPVAPAQIRQSLPMAHLTRIGVEALPEGREQLELVFSSTAFSGDTRWTHEVASAAERTLIVRALYLFST